MLQDLVGPDTWTLLQLLHVNESFLKTDPTTWDSQETYSSAKQLANSLCVVNDASERALGFITSYNTGLVTKNLNQKENLRTVVMDMRRTQHQGATSSERITKNNLKKAKKMRLNYF